MLSMKKLRSLYYKTKNAIKYSLKRNITTDELYKCNSLARGGYMSWRTYAKVVSKEVKTRRNAN
ncbi:hypothetical protein [Clostridium tertium]